MTEVYSPPRDYAGLRSLRAAPLQLLPAGTQRIILLQPCIITVGAPGLIWPAEPIPMSVVVMLGMRTGHMLYSRCKWIAPPPPPPPPPGHPGPAKVHEIGVEVWCATLKPRHAWMSWLVTLDCM